MKDAVISVPSGNPERQEETRLHRYELRGGSDAITMVPWGVTDFIPPHRTTTIPGQDMTEKILEHRAETDHARRVRRAATH